MRIAGISLLVLALFGFAGCRKSGTPGTSSATDAVEAQLRKLAGSDATNCGRISVATELKNSADCAMQANAAKHPFYVAYDLPGGEAGKITFAFAGAADGTVYRVEHNPNGWPTQPSGGQLSEDKRTFTATCSAPLRVAQSGRVTCLPPMSGMGGGSPHGMMNMPGGGNPHGEMTMPPPGTANPHSGMAPNHGAADTGKRKQ
jgi:hypothetical protein